MPNVGYWTALDDALALNAPVIVASMDQTAALDGTLGDRYVSEFYGLRPEVLLTLYVERELWERFLARVGEGSAAVCVGASEPAADRCGNVPAVALLRPTSAR